MSNDNYNEYQYVDEENQNYQAETTTEATPVASSWLDKIKLFASTAITRITQIVVI